MADMLTKEIEKMQAEKDGINANSVENFQKFIYELFEKNGILNDLRAYLRKHIVNVLKTARTGDTPGCQKLFTQRLQLNYQALNILIVEHFMRLEFSYSLSVFLSELPLSEMIFDFAKNLMKKSDNEIPDSRFTDNDILSILQHLGIKCDSKQIFQIVQTYKNDVNQSLLICILKFLPNIHGLIKLEEAISMETVASEKSSKALKTPTHIFHNECSHISSCVTCQGRMLEYKNVYKQKKKYLYKNLSSIIKPLNSVDVVKNIGILECSLIEEMFQELNTVFEAEIGMVKQDKTKYKQSVAEIIQKQREELQAEYKTREKELEENIMKKKRFLWGLARSLRDQHAHLQNAMKKVRTETDRLYAKEQTFKTQLEEAELILKKRGEEMRAQISEELAILEAHLVLMKNERECINKEREELKKLKNIENTNKTIDKNKNIASEELQTHYELLKNELSILKKFLESSKFSPKCVIERGTVMETDDLMTNQGLNNSQTPERNKNDDDKLKDQVVNDFRKKNVNFNPSKLDELNSEQNYTHSPSTESSVAGDSTAQCETKERLNLHRLRKENHRLKNFAKQQKYQIEAMSRACAHVSASPRSGHALAPHSPRGGPAPAPPSPRTPPARPPAPATATQPQRRQTSSFLQNINSTPSSNVNAPINVGWRKGAGEEVSMFRDAQPRILVPGDEIPFVGVLRDRERHTTRRQLLSQWRAMKSRHSPLMRLGRRSQSPITSLTAAQPSGAGHTEATASGPLTTCTLNVDTVVGQGEKSQNMKNVRSKSPKSVLKEAKQNLRNIKDTSVAAREKSPSTVLREAKMRLRKLEIEAEAVEKSYQDFRRRQSNLKLEKNTRPSKENVISHSVNIVKTVDLAITHSEKKTESSSSIPAEVESSLSCCGQSLRQDIDKYLREYHADISIEGLQLEYQNTINSTRRITNNYKTEFEQTTERANLLATPLPEFRKLYKSDKRINNDSREIIIDSHITSEETLKDEQDPRPLNADFLKDDTDNSNTKEKLIIQTQDINSKAVEPVIIATTIRDNQHLLRVEVESGNKLKTEFEDVSLVVENAIDIKEITSHTSAATGSRPFTVMITPENSSVLMRESVGVDVPFFEPVIRSSSPEQEAHLTRNDVLDAIFQGDSHDIKPRLIECDGSKDTMDDLNEDFTDNLSADVDNYSVPSVNTLSMCKNSEDEMYWDNV